MDSVAEQNVIIEIDGSNISGVTVNAMCDLLSNEYKDFCKAVGTLFDQELKFNLSHINNDRKYQYLYRVAISNRLYADDVGMKILSCISEIFSNIVSAATEKKKKIVDLKLYKNREQWKELGNLRGAPLTLKEQLAAVKFDKRILKKLRKNNIVARFIVSSESMPVVVVNPEPESPTKLDLFPPDLLPADYEIIRAQEPEELEIYDFEVVSVNFCTNALFILKIGNDQILVKVPTDISNSIKLQMVQHLKSKLGSSIKIVTTNKFCGNSMIRNILPKEEEDSGN